jgi:hypothetical protein
MIDWIHRIFIYLAAVSGSRDAAILFTSGQSSSGMSH